MSETTATMHNTTPGKDSKPLQILIAEDEGDICFLLNIMLKKDDTELEHVNTIAQAKIFLSEQTPDLVIIDNKLPDGYGVDFLPEIKSNYPGVKIIMISGNSNNSDKEKAAKNGADIFIGKPFTKEQMQKAINELVGYSA